jgi:hypothetical protein
MLLTQVISIVQEYWPFIIPSVICAYFLRNKYGYGIHKYPGPLLAAYTDWWRFFDALDRKSEKTFIALHEKYGDIVRIGPNALSFADPKALKTIYGLNKGFTKVCLSMLVKVNAILTSNSLNSTLCNKAS